MKFNIKLLSQDIRNKRLIEDKGFRQAAQDSDISSATLCRVENGQVPDIYTFGKLCTWLHGEPNRYFKKV